MKETIQEEATNQKSVLRYTTHSRTITETDIVNFVNLTHILEPLFIDMEFIKNKMPESFKKRFAPAPLLISVGIGLAASVIIQASADITAKEKLGGYLGLIGIDSKIMSPTYPGDTLTVELEPSVIKTTSQGQIIVGFRHILKKQTGEVVVDFTEKILFLPAEDKESA